MEPDMIKIKMNDISMIEADYEKLHISLINDTGVLLHTIKCVSHLDLLQKYTELTAHFVDSTKGKQMSICISGGHETSFSSKNYIKGSSFMDYSVRE
jgi:hypothetical protein